MKTPSFCRSGFVLLIPRGVILGGFWEEGTSSFPLFRFLKGNASAGRGAGVLPVEEAAVLESSVKGLCSPICSFPIEDSSSGSENGSKFSV